MKPERLTEGIISDFVDTFMNKFFRGTGGRERDEEVEKIIQNDPKLRRKARELEQNAQEMEQALEDKLKKAKEDPLF